MSFWTFFLYFLGAIVLLRVLYVVFIYTLIVILGEILGVYRTPDYNKAPTYAHQKTEAKEFPNHLSGELAKKLGDLS